jgi:tetratricopeptide (TPR) repeat protein
MRKSALGLNGTHSWSAPPRCTWAGKTADSEAGYRKALSEAQSLNIDPASVAIVWRNLGVTYWQLGRFVESESSHKRALAELERLLPEDRLVLILSAEMLQFYIRTNQIAKAERFEKHCREAAWWTSSSSQMAHVLNAVGMVRFAQRRFDEAEALFTEASAMEQRSTPDPALRTNLSANFAALYFSTSRAGDAVRLFQRALDEERSRSGARSPTLVTDLRNLALSYEAMGRNDEAAGTLQQALSIADESYPRRHPVRVELLGSYARVLKSLHRNKESKVAARQAREIAHNTASLGGSSLLVDIADLTKPSVGR